MSRRYCKFCGNAIDKNDIFCKDCGAEVKNNEDIADALIEVDKTSKKDTNYLWLLIMILLIIIVIITGFLILFKK